MSASVEPLIGSPSPGARDALSEVVRSPLVIKENYYKYNYWGDDSIIHPDNRCSLKAAPRWGYKMKEIPHVEVYY